jgi:beta-galactosidase/beta-glucuronidase
MPKINTSAVLPEYPRPIMERNEWKNLNGLWEYAITDLGGNVPAHFDGQILVPFAVESSLSGVGQRVGAKKELWYSRSFEVPVAWKNKNVLLHFGAVDWKADIWVNDVKVGSHTGGFTPFSFDITAALSGKGNNKLVVKVWDPTDEGYQPRGKQVNNPEDIWYTPVTGIWQTVWLEPVTARHIEELRITPDIDQHLLTVKAHLNMRAPSDLIEVNVYDGNQLVATGKSINDEAVVIPMPEDAKLWSPDFPFLYTLKVMLKSDNKILDQVNSYAAMRKYSTKRDANGIVRLELNNQPLFQFGPLDQGWWPDGLYTAPTDEALVYDIQKTKYLGFNMIRKHIKVEPARWYTHCDQLGIIVWQDMPSGDRNPEWQNRKYFEGTEKKRSAVSEACYRKEWKEIMDCLYSYPCIGTWVPFNEAWGQFKTPEIAEWTKEYDPTRLVNPASGGNHYTCGDMLDLHNYPAPEMYLYDAQRANVLGEYGGIGWVVKNHIWEPDRNWGYIQFNSSKEVTDEYIKYTDMLYDLIIRGFSAAVYTQTTDVEVEVNGLMTYDRKVIKVDEKRVREANARVCKSLK